MDGKYPLNVCCYPLLQVKYARPYSSLSHETRISGPRVPGSPGSRRIRGLKNPCSNASFYIIRRGLSVLLWYSLERIHMGEPRTREESACAWLAVCAGGRSLPCQWKHPMRNSISSKTTLLGLLAMASLLLGHTDPHDIPGSACDLSVDPG